MFNFQYSAGMDYDRNYKMNPDLIAMQSVKTAYNYPIVKEVISVDRYNDLIIRGDDLCYRMCFTQAYDTSELREELKSIHPEQQACHSNCLDKLKFSREIALNSLRNKDGFLNRAMRFQRHPDIQKLNTYFLQVAKESGHYNELSEKVKTLV